MSKESCIISTRKQPKNTEVVIKSYSSFKEVPKEDWDQVSQNGSVFLNSAYVSALELSKSKTFSLTFYIGYDKEAVIGIAITQQILVDKHLLEGTKLPCNINEKIKKMLLQKLETQITLCGNIFATGPFGYEAIEETWIQPFISGLLKFLLHLNEVRNIKESQKPSFLLFKEFYTDQISKQPLQSYKFRSVSIDQVMIMHVSKDWKNFDDYIAALRTKFRSRVKKTFQKSEKIRVVDLDAATIIAYQKEMEKLYNEVLDKADYKLGRLSLKSVIDFKQQLSDSFICTGFFLEERMVGFTAAFLNKDTLETQHIGLDYQMNKSFQLYQRMLYEYVKTAIMYKKRKINFGRTAETIKSSVGAKPVAMHLYIRHFNSLSNTIVSPLINLIQPNEFELRSPFKK